MSSVQQPVRSADGVTCQSIASLEEDRGFLSQTVLAQLDEAKAKAKAKFRLLSRFHNLLQASTSHYTLDGPPSERLMLKYYEYLLRTRDLALKQFSPAPSRTAGPGRCSCWSWHWPGSSTKPVSGPRCAAPSTRPGTSRAPDS